MMPPSMNIPGRRREDKCRRKEGKSQCRRSGQKSKTVPPVVVCAPPKSPSPSTNSPLPPVAVVPPTISVHIPLHTNLMKDPTAISPNVPQKEGKAIRRKERMERDQPKTAVRKKKTSSSMMQSISIDGKMSSEHDGRSGSKNDKKKHSQTSSDSGRKKSSAENRSQGSKEPSDNEEKNKKNFNKDLANNFFKHIMESQKARKRTDDARLETMPESSQINVSARALRKKVKQSLKKPLDANFFKPNGDPVWVIPERSAGECEKSEDGVTIKNPELAAAMAEDNLELDEKSWFEYITSYMSCAMPRGTCLPEDYQFDALAPADTLESNCVYVTQETVAYNTVKNLVDLSEDAIKRFSMKRDGNDENVRAATPHETLGETAGSIEAFQLKTCIISTITFNLNSTIRLNYDRHHPINSIRRLRKKMNYKYSMEYSATAGSKEKTA